MADKTETLSGSSFVGDINSDSSVHAFDGHNGAPTVNKNTDAPRALEAPEALDVAPEDIDEEKLGVQGSQSSLRRVQTSFSFFNERLSGQRKRIVVNTVLIYALMGACILGVFSIYWGSSYQRQTRFPNLRMLVVIEDDVAVNGTDPVIGNAMRQLLQTPAARELGNWMVQNTTEFRKLAADHGHDVFSEIQHQVHRQNYWTSIYVKPNATVNLRNAIINADSAYNVSYNSIVSFYETGRDMNSMTQYVTPHTQAIGRMFLGQQAHIVESLLGGVNTSQVFANIDAVRVATTPLAFTFIDARPLTDDVLVAPLQVGLIYMIIVTFFGFNFFGDLHREVIRSRVKKWHLLTYRVVASISSFLFISLFFSLVTLAFQVDFTVAFGKSGFLVYWMTTFLTMCAVGSMNEMMAMVCIMFYPPLLGFWLLFWVISNIAATFNPIALCPEFYRYTYAMPIHAAYEINKVIFFDTYKGAMGRNYAILVIWAVLAITGMGAVFFPFKKTMGKRAVEERKKIEEELLASRAKDAEGRIQFEK
ncbi:hypothetical protein JCM33374_g2313 [Metschnikowia sp. JCM 33374]|nr:hypothetical protein JCM33374_g2313 [Metschnikowia sp. JCM 33374]